MSSILIDIFETFKPKLIGIAYRMTGSRSEAEDIVHETFLKWYAADRDSIAVPYSWLATVTTRLSIDFLKSSWVNRQSYIGPWLPEPYIEEKDTPEQQREMDETLSMAMLVLLDRLTPDERAAYILHDLFHFSFDEVAQIFNKTSANCRKLASRARGKIEEERNTYSQDVSEHEEVVSAFFAAAKGGSVTDLVSVLKDNVLFHSDGGGKVSAARKILVGPDEVSALILNFVTPALQDPSSRTEQVWFNGAPGVVLYEDGEPVTAFGFDIQNKQFAKVYAIRNPDKLQCFKQTIPTQT